jgi:hypothetical protein
MRTQQGTHGQESAFLQKTAAGEGIYGSASDQPIGPFRIFPIEFVNAALASLIAHVLGSRQNSHQRVSDCLQQRAVINVLLLLKPCTHDEA